MVTEDVMEVLSGVADPEIPAVSVLELGLIESIVIEGDSVEVTCLPTFVGCPALQEIRKDIEDALTKFGVRPTVRFVYDPVWTTERITEEGRRKLKDYGLAPPKDAGTVSVQILAPTACPYCGSNDTQLDSPFGPTACRATAYCRSCRNPFEMFKPV